MDTWLKEVVFPVGTRVKRGPTWMWEYQDQGGFGTITVYEDGSYFKPSGREIWQRVMWDHGGKNGYRVGLHQDIVAARSSKTFDDLL